MRSLLILLIIAAGLALLGGALKPGGQVQENVSHLLQRWTEPKNTVDSTRGDQQVDTGHAGQGDFLAALAADANGGQADEEPQSQVAQANTAGKPALAQQAIARETVDGVPVPNVDEVLSDTAEGESSALAAGSVETASRQPAPTSEEILMLTRENDQLLRRLLRKYASN